MTYHTTTTLKRVQEAGFNAEDFDRLLDYLGKTGADDDPLPILTVLEVCGIQAAIWIISDAMEDRRLDRHLRARIAERVLSIYEDRCPGDGRIRDRIGMLYRYDAPPDQDAAVKMAAHAAVSELVETATNGLIPACYAARSAIRDRAFDVFDDAIRARKMLDMFRMEDVAPVLLNAIEDDLRKVLAQ